MEGKDIFANYTLFSTTLALTVSQLNRSTIVINDNK